MQKLLFATGERVNIGVKSLLLTTPSVSTSFVWDLFALETSKRWVATFNSSPFVVFVFFLVPTANRFGRKLWGAKYKIRHGRRTEANDLFQRKKSSSLRRMDWIYIAWVESERERVSKFDCSQPFALCTRAAAQRGSRPTQGLVCESGASRFYLEHATWRWRIIITFCNWIYSYSRRIICFTPIALLANVNIVHVWQAQTRKTSFSAELHS